MLSCPKCKRKVKRVETEYQMEIDEETYVMSDINGYRCDDCEFEFFLDESMEEFVRRISVKSATIFWERYSSKIQKFKDRLDEEG